MIFLLIHRSSPSTDTLSAYVLAVAVRDLEAFHFLANAVWKNEKIKKEIMQLVKKEVERECTHYFMFQEESQLFEKERQRRHARFFYGETLFRGRGQGTDATHRFISCCYQQKKQS